MSRCRMITCVLCVSGYCCCASICFSFDHVALIAALSVPGMISLSARDLKTIHVENVL